MTLSLPHEDIWQPERSWYACDGSQLSNWASYRKNVNIINIIIDKFQWTHPGIINHVQAHQQQGCPQLPLVSIPDVDGRSSLGRHCKVPERWPGEMVAMRWDKGNYLEVSKPVSGMLYVIYEKIMGHSVKNMGSYMGSWEVHTLISEILGYGTPTNLESQVFPCTVECLFGEELCWWSTKICKRCMFAACTLIMPLR